MKGEESDDGSDENENDKERPADSDVRDVRYQLEIPALVQQFVLGSSGHCNMSTGIQTSHM